MGRKEGATTTAPALVIAAALCVAEAERLERASLSATPDGS